MQQMQQMQMGPMGSMGFDAEKLFAAERQQLGLVRQREWWGCMCVAGRGRAAHS